MSRDAIHRRKSVKRFLFVMSDTGGGHRSSALAVRDEMVRLFGDSNRVDVADIFVESSLWPFDRFPAWYGAMVTLRSIPYGAVFHGTDRPWIPQLVSALVRPHTRRALFRFLRQHPADVIVSFHPVPNYSLVWAAQHMASPPDVVAVAVDLVTVHAAYFAPGAQAYFVPSMEARRRALQIGVPSDRLENLGGMPIRQAFVRANEISKWEARRRLGLPQDGPIVLMVGGGNGFGPLEAIVGEVAARQPDVHLVAVAGRNQELHRRLMNLTSRLALRVEGFTPNLELWMRAADILLTKAGPNTLSEACVVGLPMVIYSSLRGQEEGNADYVVDHGAGIWAPGPRRAADALMSLLADPTRRQVMAHKARSVVNPAAATTLAGRLFEMAQTQEERQQERLARGRIMSLKASSRAPDLGPG